MERKYDITNKQIRKLKKKYYNAMGDYLFYRVLNQCITNGYYYGMAKRKFKNTEIVYASGFMDLMESQPIGTSGVHRANREELHALTQDLLKDIQSKFDNAVRAKNGVNLTLDEMLTLQDEIEQNERELGILLLDKAFGAYDNLLTFYLDKSNGLIAFTRCKGVK